MEALNPGAFIGGSGGGTPGGSTTQVQFNNAGSFGGISTLTYDGSILTTSGRFINSYNAAASAPAKAFTGTWFTGGSATTTKPQVLIEPTGTTSTGWSTAGTGLGVNAASGFTGNLLDLQVNGSNRLKFNSANSDLAFSDTLASKISFRSFSLVSTLYNRTVLSCTENGVLSWPQGIGELGTVPLNTSYDIGYFPTRITFASSGGINANVQLTAASSGTLRLDNRAGGAGGLQIVNTFTDASNYERGFLRWSSNVFEVGPEAAGTGTARPMRITAATLKLPNLPTYADNAAATTGGLVAGDVYKTATGELRITV